MAGLVGNSSFIGTNGKQQFLAVTSKRVRRRGSLRIQAKIREIFMPALSSTMTEGKIVSWVKSEGDKLSKGESVVVVESDKADMDVETFYDGYLAAIMVEEGGVAPVGSAIALLAESEEEISLAKSQAHNSPFPSSSNTPSPPSENNSITPTPSPKALPASAHPASDGGRRVVATPYAKKLAKELKLDLASVTGSGPMGIIVATDVEQAAASASPPVASSTSSPVQVAVKSSSTALQTAASSISSPVQVAAKSPSTGMHTAASSTSSPVQVAAKSPSTGMHTAASSTSSPVQVAVKPPSSGNVVPFSTMQAAVSRNMVDSLAVPTFRVGYTITTDALDALYKKIKPKGVTMTALLAKATALALVAHPIVNSSCRDGKSFTYNSNVNIAVAVAVDGGLITPVLQDADKVDIYSLSRKWKELVDKARTKQLQPHEYTTGTFTLSNLGMFGVDRFDAILPPGTGAIMAVGASEPTVVATKDLKIGVKNQMQVNVTADHRVIYGADLAAFLQTLANIIEDPKNLTF